MIIKYIVLMYVFFIFFVPYSFAQVKADEHLIAQLYSEKPAYNLGEEINIYFMLINKRNAHTDNKAKKQILRLRFPNRRHVFSEYQPEESLLFDIYNEKQEKIPFESKAYINYGKANIKNFDVIWPSQINGIKINLTGSVFYYNMKEKGKYFITATYENRSKEWVDAMIKKGKINIEDLTEPIDLYWSGKIVSNTITVEIK